jgi:hypothetical protein
VTGADDDHIVGISHVKRSLPSAPRTPKDLLGFLRAL